jgi:hypothetical protein
VNAGHGATKVSMKIRSGGKCPEVNGNRYRMLAISVCRETHITLAEAMNLTLVDAYIAMGANFNGG